MGDDNFISSMTFASGEISCNCDECNCGPTVPPDIQRAVQEHLKRRRLEQPSVFESSQRFNIQQQRELIKREFGFSLWKLVLPPYHGSGNSGGDPIVEYRNSHRILFVKKMSENATIQSIGKGIIGSAAEENSRKHVNWKENSSYFLPFCSGIACGWINRTKPVEEKKSNTDDDNDNDVKNSSLGDDDNVILYTMKVSPSDLKDMQKEDGTQQLSPWVMKAIELFGSIGDNIESSDEFMLSSEQSAKVCEIIELVLNEK